MKSILLIIGLLVAGVSLATTTQPLDSVGIKEVNGKYFVLHKVEKGEGLYAIARRYKANVDDIKKANPEAGEGLKVGQIILVPINYTPETKKEDPKKEEPKKEEPKKGESVLHVVKTGETLYSISKLYNVSVDEIKIKNKLTSNNLTVGQELVIKGEKTERKPEEHHENYGGEEKQNPNVKPEEKTAPQTMDKPGYEYNATTGEVKETGFAIVAMDENMNQERSFCLHPTAPTGTIIMVTNVATNKSVFVRVVGKPLISQEQIIIKLSKAAGERLGIGENDRAEVRLNYAR
ncbi:MAG: septal ring lytic transglycosylase RlpA family protein [Bacteroidia bacterium]